MSVVNLGPNNQQVDLNDEQSISQNFSLILEFLTLSGCDQTGSTNGALFGSNKQNIECLNEARQIYNNKCNEESINPFVCNRNNIKATANQKYNYYLCLYRKLYKAYMILKNSNDPIIVDKAKQLYPHVKELNVNINTIAKKYYNNYIVNDTKISSELSETIDNDSLTISNNNNVLKNQSKFLNENIYLNPELDKRLNDANSGLENISLKYNILLIGNILLIIILFTVLIINFTKKI
jgi:hypothetical protein